MNVEEYHVYLIEGNEQLAIIAAGNEERRANHAEIWAWAKTVGGDGYQRGYSGVAGVLFQPSSVPDVKLWRKAETARDVTDGRVAYVPRRNSKVAKEIARQMDSFRIPNATTVAAKLGGKSCCLRVNPHGRGMLMSDSCILAVGDKYVLLDPKTDERGDAKVESPRDIPGCRLLKLSEFYAMREAAEAADKEGK